MLPQNTVIKNRTPDYPLTDGLFPSRKSTMNDSDDDDENDTFSSAAASSETSEGTSSTGTCNESNCCEFRNYGDSNGGMEDTDDHYTTSKHSKGNEEQQQQQQHRLEMLVSRIVSPSSRGLFENNAFTFVLIPAALVVAYAFFGTGPLSPSVDTSGPVGITAIRSSLLALASYISQRYMTSLEEYPVLTKSLTTGIIQLFGDYAAQRYEQQQQQQQQQEDNKANTNTIIHSAGKGYDLRRGLSLFADGLFLSGPLLHYCFEWMEDAWPTISEGGDNNNDGTVGLSRPLATLCHVFVNDYIIDSVYIGLSFVFTGVVEGYSLGDVAEIFRKDYGATVRASWLTSLGLIPVEILCFGYLSLSFRVLAMNFVDLLWGAIVSFYSHRSRRENSKKASAAVVQQQ